jgi:hypothetical protein
MVSLRDFDCAIKVYFVLVLLLHITKLKSRSITSDWVTKTVCGKPSTHAFICTGDFNVR